MLLAYRKVDLHKLVAAFFKIGTRHDRQINGPAQIDQVSIALILDFELLLFLSIFVFRALV